MSFFGKSRQSEPLPRIGGDAPRMDGPAAPIAPPSPVGFETVLGANSVLEGALKSAANVRLDGTFTGTLEITGNVLVGETARITADINAKNISIAGAVRGNVGGKKVQLLRTGRIWGDIRAQALTTEEGAFIDGKITMIGSDPTAPVPSFDNPAPLPDEPDLDQPEDSEPTGEERLAAIVDESMAELADEPAAELPASPVSSENGGESTVILNVDEGVVEATLTDEETPFDAPDEPIDETAKPDNET
jgi:cytoskeletal protein CcmA (bactofilin family)